MIIAVRRQDRHEALAGLTVADEKILINVMSGVGNDDLRQTLATDAPLVRAIPLPAIRERRSVTVTSACTSGNSSTSPDEASATGRPVSSR